MPIEENEEDAYWKRSYWESPEQKDLRRLKDRACYYEVLFWAMFMILTAVVISVFSSR